MIPKLNVLLFVAFLFNLSNAVRYDSYYEQPITEARLAELQAANALSKCTVDLQNCTETEGRRLDGSCNNLQYPSDGGFFTPHLRLLPAVYDEYFESRKSKSGAPLALPRDLRQGLLKVGTSFSPIFTQAVSLYAEFIVNDIVSVQDITNYLTQTTYCCEEKGKSDYMCTPNIIPDYDPVHRFTKYRCMNQTRPLSYQNQGCVANNTTPERIDSTTVFWDLHNLYYYTVTAPTVMRNYTGGLLKTETINGRVYPSDGNSSCKIQDVIDTGCTRTVPNGLMGSHMFITLYWRLHNYIARGLAKVNNSWDDDKLFNTSRDITIGLYQHLMYNEFWPLMIGKDTLVADGIIAENASGYRNLYNASIPPKVYLEYALANRWFHLTQWGTILYFTENGTRVGEGRVAEFSKKVFKITINDTMVYLTRALTKQNGGGFDTVIDSDIAEVALGPLQLIIDLFTQDINKGRLFGSAPYKDYRDMRMGYNKSHSTFEDFEYIMSEENLELMKLFCEYVEDMELLPGIMLENYVEGGHIPDTLAWIVRKQLKQSLITDRHWYESSTRPNSYTLEQLKEIRKSTLAMLLCTVGDEVTQVQSRAFEIISTENPLVSCDDLPKLNFTLWKE